MTAAARALDFPPVTTIAGITDPPPAAAKHVRRVHLRALVYFYDPGWNVFWGRFGDINSYLGVPDPKVPLRPGDQLVIDGLILPGQVMQITDPRIQVVGHVRLPSPDSIDGRIDHVARYNGRRVTLTGYVDHQIRTDLGHLDLKLLADNRLVTVRLLTPKGNTPTLEHARLRVTGVYSANADPAGGPPTIEIWVQGLSDVHEVGDLAHDPAFARRITPIDHLGSAPAETAVHVAGIVQDQQPGSYLVIRDETGQTTVFSPQTERLPLGTHVEAVGQPQRRGDDLNLVQAVYRRGNTQPPAPQGPRPIRLADDLRSLSADLAAQRCPVDLTGVVTWADPHASFFYMHDSSGGAFVIPPRGAPRVYVGRRVRIRGVSGIGAFTPIALATSIQLGGAVSLPASHAVTLEQALTGIEEAEWVSMIGYVRSERPDGPWERLELTTPAGVFSALMPPPLYGRNVPLSGAVVRLRGVCSAVTNRRHQLVGVQLWVPSLDYVEIEEAAPANPFALPLHSISSLLQFNSVRALSHRVRVIGTVLSQIPGRAIHLEEHGDALLVLSHLKAPLNPGDRIEAVGFPGRESSRLVLREAVYRRLNPGREPAPLRLGTVLPVVVGDDGRLVTTEAELLDIAQKEDGTRLILRQNATLFEADLAVSRAQLSPDAIPGSRVGLTGVYVVGFDDYNQPRTATLQLRSAADLSVLQRPPWWTVRRALTLGGILAAAAALGLVWAIALRRRVHQQTRQIRERFERERAAREEVALVRASKLESLGILAGGIAHDFNNLLTVIMCNLSLVRSTSSLEAELEQCLADTERAAVRARDLTQQLLTFAKGGDPIRSSTVLAEVVREAAEFVLHGSKSRCQFRFAADLWPADVDRGQIGQVVQNLVINASQAMVEGGSITIAIENAELHDEQVPALKAGRYLKVEIADTGVGIPADRLPRIFEPYFTTKLQGSGLGLATVYSIVKKHRGHIEVRSVPGEGTTFTFWLPAARQAPVPKPTDDGIHRSCTGSVLFMDDEESIRNLAAFVLRRAGLDVTLASDGAGAVAAYRETISQRRQFDAVVLDLTVPGGMGGMETLRRLMAIDPHVKAIVSSGYASDPIMADYREHGFVALVCKPYQADALTRTVVQVVQSPARPELVI